MKWEKEFLMDLGYRLKESRERKSLTIEDAARNAGISKRFLYQIEEGKKCPSVIDITKLARLDQVGADYLLEDITHERLSQTFEKIQAERPDIKFCGYTGPPFGMWDYKSRKATSEILKNALKKESVN